MSFNVQPKSGPSIANPPNAQASAREAAIAAFKSAPPQAQENPVVNPTNISPEEMSAIVPPSQKPDKNSVQANTDEKPTLGEPPEAPVAKPEDPLSSQYAVLARKEKALRAKVQQQESAIKAKEASILAREEAIKAKEAQYATDYVPKSRLLEDTMGVLSEVGMSYDQLTERVLSQPQVQQDPATKAAIARLEAQVKAQAEAAEKAQKAAADAQQQQYQSAVNQIHNDVKNLVAKSDDFEAIRETDSVKDVVELIETTFHKGMGDEYPPGTVLDTETAARMVEEHLIEEMTRLSRMKKLQARLQPKPEPKQPAVPAVSTDPKTPQLKTLTNNLGSSRPLTAKERAILAFKGEKR
jgi:hypothetical protein